jgi:cytochrome c oxidase assembly protein subunit 20
MASGMNTDEAPPLPPPDYRPQSTEEFAKQKAPPLRGLIVDPKYPPTVSEAQAIWTAKDAETRKNLPPPTVEEQLGKDVRRSSGTSQILNTAAAPTINETINTMPGGTYHTAGGKASMDTEPTLLNAVKTITPASYKDFHKQPCVREAMLQGMAAGFLVAGITFISGRPVAKAANYAVYAFIPTSVAGHQYCQYQRRREREGMRMAIQIIEEKKEEKARLAAEKREKWRKLRDEKRAQEEAEAAAKREAERRWWHIWQGRGGSGNESGKES